MTIELAFWNDRLLPAAEARLPLYDAGFVLGATATEQLRTFGGRLFRLEQHLARLRRSLELMGLDPSIAGGRLAEAAERLATGNHRLLQPGDDLGLCIFVTPGPYAALAPADAESRPTVGMHTYPLPFALWAGKYRDGQALATTAVAQVPADCWPSELKCRSRMHYYLADRAAAAAGQPGARAVLLDAAGRVTETSTANVVAYSAERGLVSPPPERVLPGVSLAVVEELAAGLGIRWERRDLTADELTAADEVLLTSTPWCLLPVTRINGQSPLSPRGESEAEGRAASDRPPGRWPIYHRLLAAWNELVGCDIAAQAKRFSQRG